ncbi:MAG: hypothetical protein JSU72_15225 [Deltaproteobacteria bacterium]|nr:MAG: hypothetical protein JSU72_15225 [Deltaproteobacteria bacterium]
MKRCKVEGCDVGILPEKEYCGKHERAAKRTAAFAQARARQEKKSRGQKPRRNIGGIGQGLKKASEQDRENFIQAKMAADNMTRQQVLDFMDWQKRMKERDKREAAKRAAELQAQLRAEEKRAAQAKAEQMKARKAAK